MGPRLYLCLALVATILTSASAQSEAVPLDAVAFRQNITQVLKTSGTLGKGGPLAVRIPWWGGSDTLVDLTEASQFEPGLAARYPAIQSFRVSVHGSSEVIGRLNVSEEGVFALLFTPTGPVELQHVREGNATVHRLVAIDLAAERARMSCEVGVEELAPSGKTQEAARINNCYQLGATLRRYRMALTNTGEFAQLNGGTLAGVNAAFNNRLAELNAIWEREANVTFQLIAGNDVLVNLNPATDPFSNPSNSTTSLNETEPYIEGLIPNANYDIGHGLHAETSGSIAGLAGVGVVCVNGAKARGWSTIFQNSSLAILQHEVGHQFSCLHTNYGCGNTGAQRFEPGQGVTIMATSAGCTPGDTYDSRNSTYFHVGSVRAINTFIAGTGSCFTAVATTNTAPTANANPNAGTYTIPARTSFRLTGTGTDPNGGALTFNWEQIDTDAATTALPTATAAIPTAPLFRSFAPGTSTTRYFPRLSTILAGTTPTGVDGEILPTVNRSMAFDFSVRDGVGGIACDEIGITVANTGAPFLVTSQNSATAWTANGTNQATVTWDVAGTTANGINAANVDILLSTDGGQTFNFAIASATPNDGTHTFTIPNFPTSLGRVMVIGTGNIFLDINNADITITSGSGCLAASAAIAPTTSVSAVAGSMALDLSLAPSFGTAQPSPLAFMMDASDPSGNVVAEDDPSNSCISYNFGGSRYEVRALTVAVAGSYTFTSSANAYVATLFSGPYMNSCAGYLGSTGALTNPGGGNPINIAQQPFTVSLVAGQQLTLVVITPFNTVGTGNISYTGPGQFFSGTPPPPAGYSYTFGIVNNGSGLIVAFDASSDLSNAGTFTAGSYSVFGLSYQNGSNLNAFVGQTYTALQNAIALGNPCAALSTNQVSVSILAPLPVTLVSLRGEAQDKGNVLAWATASERGTSHFEVQRLDGGDFVPVGKVDALDASRGAAYTFTDPWLQAGTQYYRLDIVDFDGFRENSAVVAIERSPEGGGKDLIVWPNPLAGDELEVSLVGFAETPALTLELIDLHGRVLHRTQAPAAATQTLRLDVPAGVYLLVVRTPGDGVVTSRRVVKTR